MKPLYLLFVSLALGPLQQCSKKSGGGNPPPRPENFVASSVTVDGESGQPLSGVSRSPSILFSFPLALDKNTVNAGISLKNNAGNAVPFSTAFQKGDSVLLVQPAQPLAALTNYFITLSSPLKSAAGGSFTGTKEVSFTTGLDSSDKFPRISDEALLTVVQQQTFKYFWDFAHPVSGLARERNTSADVVTSGGSGFGIMAIVVAVHRQFIGRTEGLARMQKIVDFLKTKTDRFHGAFPHWLNGSTGKTVPFSAKDDGADLVETSFLMQGLLTARQFFNGASAAETALRNDINQLWSEVEWNWFRKGSENVLYWHWSQNHNWEMNHKIQGWNEALITYVLAASSPHHSIPKAVYDEGWARGGAMRNGNSYYGYRLPLGPQDGGPLFFSQYSFLGINPKDLKDQYADYWEQNRNHSLINYAYCKTNPKKFYGYSEACWGLTASDDNKVGYLAHEPAADNGVVSPTAALSSMPYTPDESVRALKFFYYTLGDKLWKEYGFTDAFNLTDIWFADSFLAIDQGPVIVMIENHRSGLLWNLFMSCPEVKEGMKKLGFSSPNLN